MAPLSLRGYAKHRRAARLPGGTLRSVQRALADGRIIIDGAGKIDPATADASWVANTDDSRRPRPGRAADPPRAGSLAEQKRLESFQRTRELTRENDVAEGRLVPTEGYKRAEVARVVRAKNVLLRIPSQFKGRHPEVSRDAVVDLDSLIRGALEELADGRADAENES